MKFNFKILALCATAVGILAGCSERPQAGISAAKRPDVAPYMGANDGFMTKGWTPGNELSWKEAINKRNQQQTEYTRIK
ncbi:hypothetical protein FD975_06400 [Polynucleobacter sp. AP-Jannik-300A-C4]|uniref:hypothetical protein n=1 Tax=Polynucleobacter sp. AP-Jannik-300A-C4 TaxID=2576928 RepID=UPI001BFEBB77|nr:hypothetical protein [Polynucleobacter sp. AP-Jannik-300A-C4]QWE21910.1 hypothetical protein FD975_06400 [Polynucleobacter sp. AP-Jannik-300A-C4]